MRSEKAGCGGREHLDKIDLRDTVDCVGPDSHNNSEKTFKKQSGKSE